MTQLQGHSEPVNAMLDHALGWAKRGLRVFPVREGSKAPPLVKDWPEVATSDPAKIRELWERWPNANIGATGAVVLDVDVRDEKPGVESLKALGLPPADLRDAITVKTPSGGLHLYYAQPDGTLIASRNGFRPGLDLKADAGYVLAPGSRIEGADNRYEIYRDPGRLVPCPFRLVEVICAETAPRKKSDRGTVAPGAVEDDPAMIARAADWLANKAQPAVWGEHGDETTFKVACQLHDWGLSLSTAFDLMAEHYNPRCAPPWDLDGPKSLLEKVESAWHSAQNPLGSKHPGAIAAAEFGDVKIEPPRHKPRTALELRLVRQGDPITRASWLLKGLMPRVGTGLLVGPYGGGKTFLAAQLAKSLATGEPFFGKEPKEKVGTLILAAEGVGGLQSRLNVLAPDGGLPIYALPVGSLASKEALGLLHADIAEVAALCAKEHGLRLGLVILDTLAASGLLSNENDNSLCAAAIKVLESIAIEQGCVALATHHPPKAGTDPRGGSALGAGADFIWTITRPGQLSVRGLTCTKSRDSKEGPCGSFTLLSVVVGLDEDGEPITSCSVSMSDAPVPTICDPERAPPTPEEVAEIVNRIEEGAPDGYPWRYAFSAHDGGDNWAGVPIGDAMGFVALGSSEQSRAQAVLNGLIARGILAKGDRSDPAAPRNEKLRKPVPFVRVP